MKKTFFSKNTKKVPALSEVKLSKINGGFKSDVLSAPDSVDCTNTDSVDCTSELASGGGTTDTYQ